MCSGCFPGPMLAREEPRWVGSSTLVGGPDQEFIGLSCCPAGAWDDRVKYFSASTHMLALSRVLES